MFEPADNYVLLDADSMILRTFVDTIAFLIGSASTDELEDHSQNLLSQFYEQYKLAGMQRPKVIELLGAPAIATELYSSSARSGRIDTYRLSAKNTKSLHIKYDAQDRVTGSPVIDPPPCQTRLFIGPAPADWRLYPQMSRAACRSS